MNVLATRSVRSQDRIGPALLRLLPVIAAALVTCACGDDSGDEKARHAAELQIQKLENRLLAAEHKVKEVAGQAREAEKARQEATARLQYLENSSSFHGLLSILFACLAVVSYNVGHRKGREQGLDDKAIRNSYQEQG